MTEPIDLPHAIQILRELREMALRPNMEKIPEWRHWQTEEQLRELQQLVLRLTGGAS